MNRAHVDHVLATIDHAIDESSFWSPDAMRWAVLTRTHDALRRKEQV